MASKYQECMTGCESQKTLSDSIGSFTESIGSLVFRLILIYIIIIATSFGLFSRLPFVRSQSIL